jgi:hypothetical protein
MVCYPYGDPLLPSSNKFSLYLKLNSNTNLQVQYQFKVLNQICNEKTYTAKTNEKGVKFYQNKLIGMSSKY